MRIVQRPGFSVVEVLAAIALISIAIIPLYQLQRALTDAAVRLERTAQGLEVEESALALLTTVNPAATPEGSAQIGDWAMSWSSSPVAFDPDAAGFRGQSNFSVGLYEITVTLQRNDYARQLVVRQLGWTLIRNPLEDFGL